MALSPWVARQATNEIIVSRPFRHDRPFVWTKSAEAILAKLESIQCQLWRPFGMRLQRHLPHRVLTCRGEDNLRPLDVFARPVSVGRDCRQLLALRSAQYHTYLL
jgi:hypothetical protein